MNCPPWNYCTTLLQSCELPRTLSFILILTIVICLPGCLQDVRPKTDSRKKGLAEIHTSYIHTTFFDRRKSGTSQHKEQRERHSRHSRSAPASFLSSRKGMEEKPCPPLIKNRKTLMDLRLCWFDLVFLLCVCFILFPP